MATIEQGAAPTPAGQQHNANVLNVVLVRYVEHRLGPAAIPALLERAEETRTLEELRDPAGWSTYWQTRRLLEAGAEMLGGPSELQLAGAYYDREKSPASSNDMIALFQSLGGPAGILRLITETAAKYSTIIAMQAEEVADDHGVVLAHSVPGFPRYRHLCDLTAGLLSLGGKIFGLPGCDVVEEQCEVRGDAICRYRVSWVTAPQDAEARLQHLEQELTGLKGRFNALKSTVGDLVSGDDVETVLGRIVNRAALAIRAPQYLLAVRTREGAAVRVHALGFSDAADPQRLADGLLSHDPDDAERSRLIVDVRSGRRYYGRLVAINKPGVGFFPEERSILSSYAELAAAALDSATALEEARNQAASAEALLDLASALAKVSTRGDVAARLAAAVPTVVGSTSASVMLWDGKQLTAVASAGMSPEAVRLFSTYELKLPSTGALQGAIDRREPYFVDGGRAGGRLAEVLQAAQARAVAVVPIFGGDTFYGVVTAGVDTDADQLRGDRHLVSRLTGLAFQAAAAFHNADLLEHIKHQALHDPLTGTSNQRLLEDEMAAALDARRRRDDRVGLLFLDLDRFKNVNDTLGHATGDELLQLVAQRLETAVRDGDTIARLGGDEFAVLLPTVVDVDDAKAVAARILQVLDEPFSVDDHEVFISASVGIAICPDDADDYIGLLKAADTAMYAAKSGGRSRFRTYIPTMPVKTLARLSLEADLHLAVSRNELRVVFQPQLDLVTMRVTGAEALVRWQHPERGLIPPDDFIPLAEETGLITSLDAWVLRQACEQLASWHGTALAGLRMSVNLSERDLHDPSLPARVAAVLEETGVPARQLELEITERVAEAAGEAMSLVLNQLHRLGVHIAIDDFGTGNAGFSRLMRGNVDTLKIDKSFLEEVRSADAEAPLVTAMISLGHSLGMQIVAEGVETAEQGAFLRRRGCDLAQGYYFSRPVPARELVELVDRRQASWLESPLR